ncbi:hypothetical protein GCM10009716_31880 [Streptomyces sodiiphilus]|uniref:Baseplate assembly protein n=1 Tax=Streptomyces sodiiphilus TaxID=226217 RepID=A0ABN2PG22_9ACTN
MSGAGAEGEGAVCRTGPRRHAVRRAPRLNGLDGIEVADDGLTLTVTFLGKAPRRVRPENIRIDGGRRVRDLRAVDVTVEREDDPELDDRMSVVLDRTGDTSRYTLCLVEPGPYGRPGSEPLSGFDPRYHRAGFSFLPGCPTPFDCVGEPEPPPAFRPAPVVDYTARDYDSLLRTALDHLALTTPDWVERHVPDLGVTLVELLAHTADRISHLQDAVGTEAYLATARRRVSVRRHTRLVDYAMHDGCNARALVVLETGRRITLRHGEYRFAAVDAGRPEPRERPALPPVLTDEILRSLDEQGPPEVFEPLERREVTLRPEHNLIRFWTWGDEECVLPRGATRATLRDAWRDGCPGSAEASAPGTDAPGTDAPGTTAGQESGEPGPGAAGGRGPGGPGRPEKPGVPRERALDLRPGDLLLIEEVLGPRSGVPADADPARRRAVRLLSVTPGYDELCDQPVVEVSWAPEDAPPFPVCLSSRGGTGCGPVADVSVARGNVVAVDHGRTVTFCGGEPEGFTVPPEPVRVPSCDPPAFGCPDPPRGNAPARAVHALIDQAGAGLQLTANQVRGLFAAVGEEAVLRAGLDVRLRPGSGGEERVLPPTADAQAEVLHRLLAQASYPGIRERFRPVLRHAPVTQAAPFPDPAVVAAGQASRLAGVPELVRQRLTELWRAAGGSEGLSRAEIAELTVLFGAEAVKEARLARRPAAALRDLLARRHRLLADKLRRLEVLTARARAGAVQGDHIAWEIARSWGERYAAGLRPDHPVLAGPVSGLPQDPRRALPAVTAAAGGEVWVPRRDLLASGHRDRHFVGELEDDGRLALRFGDGRHGAPPPPGARVEVTCRVGNGPAGNVGAEAVNHLVLCRRAGVERKVAGAVTRVRNPLPATGGTAPEPVDQVRQLAPPALRRTLLRAVTAKDYAALASGLPGVRRAAAQLRWTGSTREAHVAVDASGTGGPGPDLLDAVAQALEVFRLTGHDLVVLPARQLPLDIELRVCVAAGHRESAVRAGLRRALGTGTLPGGRPAFFHPDARTFGDPVRAGRLVAFAAAVPGVADVRVTRLRRLGGPDPGEREAGVLRPGPLEIVRCDNDPRRPEMGRLAILLGGEGL